MNNALLKELTDIDFKKILELIDKKEIPDNFDNLKDNVYRFNLDEITEAIIKPNPVNPVTASGTTTTVDKNINIAKSPIAQ